MDIAIPVALSPRARPAVVDLSFSWYCRRPVAETAGAAVRRGDAMLGLAVVASTRLAWVGTAAATLLNIVAGICGVVGGPECPSSMNTGDRCWWW